jgi:4'-phosphopantetheinyl transferase
MNAEKKIHVWRALLDVSAAEMARYSGWLSAEEQQRASAFRFAVHRDRYVACHGWLRELLADYLAILPKSLRFVPGRYGKPALADTPRMVGFSLSHSGGLAVCAVVEDAEVGVDIEVEREVADFENLARRFFHPAETEKLLSLPVAARQAAFFRCWTRKEAYIKATGEGLSAGLDTFEVTLAPDEPCAFVQIGNQQATDALGWSLFDISSDHYGTAGAVAVKGTGWVPPIVH